MRTSVDRGTPQGQKHGWKQACRTGSIIVGLAVLCLITTGVIGCGEQFSKDGGPPEIVYFQANPPINEGGPVSYTFEVKNATKIRLIEAGNTIKEIDGPSSGIYKGAATGQVPSAVLTSDNYTPGAVLEASNDYGKVEKKITQSDSPLLRLAGWIYDCTPPCKCMRSSTASSQNMTTQCSSDPCMRRSIRWFGLFGQQDSYCYRYPCEWNNIQIQTCFPDG